MPPTATPDGPGGTRVPELSLVMPAFDEEENIEGAVADALEALRRLADRFEVIVVDDGSTDQTAPRLLALLALHHPQLRVIRHERNLGYGVALRTGWQRAGYGIVAYTDSDRQFDVAELSRLLPLLEEADLVVGYRHLRSGPVHRRALGRAYNGLVSALFRLGVRDVNCALKVMKAGVLDSMELESADFFIDCELLARARRGGFQIAQVGVSLYPRAAGESTVRSSDVPRTLGTIARMWGRLSFPGRGRPGARAAAPAVEVTPATAGQGGHASIPG